MTLIVGIVGSDGIVLAADRRTTGTDLAQMSREFGYQDKILCSKSAPIACAIAGEGAAKDVAQDVVNFLRETSLGTSRPTRG